MVAIALAVINGHRRGPSRRLTLVNSLNYHYPSHHDEYFYPLFQAVRIPTAPISNQITIVTMTPIIAPVLVVQVFIPGPTVQVVVG